jgi:hypothetical protein
MELLSIVQLVCVCVCVCACVCVWGGVYQVDGMADYTGQPSYGLLSALKTSLHPSAAGLPPLDPEDKRKGWPVIVFSHGLAGCVEEKMRARECDSGQNDIRHYIVII